jgi:hypothetical protein
MSAAAHVVGSCRIRLSPVLKYGLCDHRGIYNEPKVDNATIQSFAEFGPETEGFEGFSGRQRSRQYGIYLWEHLWDYLL